MKPYSKELVNFIEKNRLKYNIGELCKMVNENFNKNLSIKHFRKYFYRHNLKYKKIRNINTNCTIAKPIGAESNKDKNGLIRVKVNEKQWVYKQRYIYEKYHNIKLPDNYVVVFLDNNKDNFEINNLMAVPIKDSLFVASQKLFTKNKDLTKLSLQIASVVNKTKELEAQNK
jgi:hypothetical protein